MVGYERLRFLVVDGRIVLIMVPGPVHDTTVFKISGLFGIWADAAGLPSFNTRHFPAGGAGHYEPDIRPSPPGSAHASDAGAPMPRLVVEVEVHHRNTTALRKQGYIYMEHHCVRAFLGVKIWPRRAGGLFAAVAILWTKDPATHAVGVAAAIEFGTAPLWPTCKTGLETGVAMALPRVPAAAWQQQMPAPAAAIILRIQPGLIVYQALDRAGFAIPVPANTMDINMLDIQQLVVGSP